ncbi:MAG: MurR/RpiR family transcriptional regulator [Thermomicrobiales bacterium]|nr:MurR/RpiR family transcriptional regulator [Thermomicrobiales bacterium]MCO5220635.1 MurR/RpiR family transcriptional regulator [Thermomicrobiales bacterium]
MPSVDVSLPKTPAGLPLTVEQFDRLSPNHQRLAQFLAENPSVVAFASASEIGRSVEMSTATVVRFAQALGYSGYPAFQEVVRAAYLRTLRPLESLENLSRSRRDIFEGQVHRDIDNLRRSLHTLMVDRSAIIDLARRIAASSGVVVAANGVDGAIALLLGHYLRLLGFRSLTELRGGGDLVEAIAPLGAGDCLIAIEFGQSEGGLAKTIAWAQSRGVFTAAITDSAYSATARAADAVFVQVTEGETAIRSFVAPLSMIQGLLGHLLQISSPEAQLRFKDALDELARSGR